MPRLFSKYHDAGIICDVRFSSMSKDCRISIAILVYVSIFIIYWYQADFFSEGNTTLRFLEKIIYTRMHHIRLNQP